MSKSRKADRRRVTAQPPVRIIILEMTDNPSSPITEPSE